MNKGVGAGNSRHVRREVWTPPKHPHLKTATTDQLINPPPPQPPPENSIVVLVQKEDTLQVLL